MTFTLFWIICVVYSGLAMIGLEAWDLRHNPRFESTTLQDIMVGICLALAPIINALVCIGCTIYAFVEIAPKIVLFRPKPQPAAREPVKAESEVQL